MSKANGRQNRRTTIPWQKSRGGHPKERLKSVFTVGPTAGFSSSADQLLSLHSTVQIGAFCQDLVQCPACKGSRKKNLNCEFTLHL